MKAKTLAIVMLAALLVMVAALAAGCGGGATGATGRAGLSAALSEFELSAGAVTQALAAGTDATVAPDIKAAKADMKTKWQAVISAAKDMKWPDKDMAEEAWSNVENAIDSLPENATVEGANAALTPSMDALMAVEAELWNLVQTTE